MVWMRRGPCKHMALVWWSRPRGRSRGSADQTARLGGPGPCSEGGATARRSGRPPREALTRGLRSSSRKRTIDLFGGVHRNDVCFSHGSFPWFCTLWNVIVENKTLCANNTLVKHCCFSPFFLGGGGTTLSFEPHWLSRKTIDYWRMILVCPCIWLSGWWTVTSGQRQPQPFPHVQIGKLKFPVLDFPPPPPPRVQGWKLEISSSGIFAFVR